jgi:hypothetical protein
VYPHSSSNGAACLAGAVSVDAALFWVGTSVGLFAVLTLVTAMVPDRI